VDGDGALAEIEVLDAQAHGFHEAEAAAVHELGGEFPWFFEVSDNRADFITGHRDGRAALAAGGSDVVEVEFLYAADFFHEEDHGVERLLLGGGSDVALKGSLDHASPEPEAPATFPDHALPAWMAVTAMV
jgi:hypothetical protein